MAQPEVSAELQRFIQQETQMAQVQQMVATLTDVCWDKCMSSAPGTYMSSKETTCLQNCAKTFVEATQFVLQRAQHKAGGAEGMGNF
mmetsp:Transcript_13828/g.24198  ORF Transcript_13828/g.24198 Transcript_13828/m.24198 type:complete len:87 (-) Transcript_13828:324-584(-)